MWPDLAKFQSLWQKIEWIFSPRKNVLQLRKVFMPMGLIFMANYKWPNIEQTICQSWHTWYTPSASFTCFNYRRKVVKFCRVWAINCFNFFFNKKWLKYLTVCRQGRDSFLLSIFFERKQKRNTQKNGSKKFQSRRVSPSRRDKKVAAGNLLQNKKSTNQDNVKTHSTENAKTHILDSF